MKALSRRKVLQFGGIVLGAVGVIGLFIDTAMSRAEQKSPIAGRKASIERKASAVGALGRIEPRSEVIQVGAAIDDRLARLVVAEGDSVKAGDVLGYLESFRERSADRDRIAAQLKEAEHLYEAETRLGESAIREAELRIRRASEVTEPRMASQRAKVQSMEAELANSKDILSSRERLLTSGSSTRRTVDDQRTIVTRNERALRVEQQELERLRTELDVDRLTATTQLERSRAELTRAQSNAGVETLRRQLEVAEARAALAQITAPISGQILKIMLQPGTRIGSAPILKMGDTSEMHAVAEVYETDIARIKLGQSATVRSRAFSRPLTGEVVKIGTMIFKNDVLDVDPAAKVDARVVEVRVRLNESDVAKNLTNLSVDVVIDSTDAASAKTSLAR